MKGITPVLAIITLLMITVALAGSAWIFLYGYSSTSISGKFDIPPGSAYCVNSSGGYLIFVQVTNVGTETLRKSDFTIFNVDSIDVMVQVDAGLSIPPGSAYLALDGYNCGSPTGCALGKHYISVATSSTVLNVDTYCT